MCLTIYCQVANKTQDHLHAFYIGSGWYLKEEKQQSDKIILDEKPKEPLKKKKMVAEKLNPFFKAFVVLGIGIKPLLGVNVGIHSHLGSFHISKGTSEFLDVVTLNIERSGFTRFLGYSTKSWHGFSLDISYTQYFIREYFGSFRPDDCRSTGCEQPALTREAKVRGIELGLSFRIGTISFAYFTITTIQVSRNL